MRIYADILYMHVGIRPQIVLRSRQNDRQNNKFIYILLYVRLIDFTDELGTAFGFGCMGIFDFINLSMSTSTLSMSTVDNRHLLVLQSGQ